MNILKQTYAVVALVAMMLCPQSVWADCAINGHSYTSKLQQDGSYSVSCDQCQNTISLDNVILYTTSNGKKVDLSFAALDFGATMLGHNYDGDCGIIYFNGAVNKIPDSFLEGFSSIDYYNVSSIIIPSQVNSIGSKAFYLCFALESVIFSGDLVAEIGSNAFYGCDLLASDFVFSCSLRSIGQNAFLGCNSLGSLTFHSFPNFGGKDQYNTSVIVNLTKDSYVCCESQFSLPTFSSLKYTYSSNEDWGALVLPFTVRTTNDVQLYDFELYVPSSHNFMMKKVDRIDPNTPFIFKKKTGTQSVDFSNVGRVESPSTALKSCTFDDFTIYGAYSTQSGLSSCYALDGGAFKPSTASVSPFNVWINGTDGVDQYMLSLEYGTIYYTTFDNSKLFVKDGSGNYPSVADAVMLEDKFENGKGTILFDSPVTKIFDNAFQNKVELTSIELPNTLTTLGKKSFDGCVKLNNVVIPQGVSKIEDYCFQSCSSLSEIDLGNVSFISTYAFNQCIGLETITLPSSVSELSGYAFSNCSNLWQVKFTGTKLSAIAGNVFINCSELYDITLPSSIIQIGAKAFSGCSSLGSNGHTFIIPSSVSTISGSAFSGCSGLVSIVIPNGVTSISTSTFKGCSGLQSITIPSTISIIGANAFEGCTTLASITIPSNVTNISNYCFSGCTGLNNVILPSNIKTVGKGSFMNCTSLESLEFTNSLTTIEEQAFAECGDLTVKFNNLPLLSSYNAFTGCKKAEIELTDDSYIYVGGNSQWSGVNPNITSASYSRSMANAWGTAILPYEVSSNDDVQCYEMCGSSDDGLVFSPVKTVAANTPFVFKKLDKDAAEVTIKGSNVVSVATAQYEVPASAENWTLGGTYAPIAKSGVYFISQDKFWLAQVAPTFKKFRVWMSNTGYSAASLRIMVEQNEFETSILEIAEDGSVQDATQGIYDLSGHKLSAPVKGQMNIINGKKVFIK